jgi:hypothetical protein
MVSMIIHIQINALLFVIIPHLTSVFAKSCIQAHTCNNNTQYLETSHVEAKSSEANCDVTFKIIVEFEIIIIDF